MGNIEVGMLIGATCMKASSRNGGPHAYKTKLG